MVTPQKRQTQASGRWLFRSLVLLLCGLSLLTQAGFDVALPISHASPQKALRASTVSGTGFDNDHQSGAGASLAVSPKSCQKNSDLATSCPRPDLSIVKVYIEAGPFRVGQTVGYSLNVSNVSGDGSVAQGQSIRVVDNIPVGLTNVTVSGGTDWNIDTISNRITATYAGPYPVAPGAHLHLINVIGILTSSEMDSLNNTATVSTPLDNNPDNNTSSKTLAMCPPDLAITKSHQGAGPFQVGQAFSFVMSVTNLAGSGAVLPGKVIIVTDHIPAGLINATATGTNWSTVITNGTLTATYTGSLPMPAGTTLSEIILSGQLGSAAVPTLDNTATVFTPDDDNLANNTASDSITVAPLPDLAISLIHAGRGCVVDGIVAYTLTVSNAANAGPIFGGPITVSANIPTDIGGTSADGAGSWNITAIGGAVNATYIGSYPIPAGATLPPISITGALNSPSSPTLRATATVSLSNDSNSSNNTTSDTITICPPDLAIVKSHQGSGPFYMGQSFSFVLSVSNGPYSGPVFSGSAITVTDHLPDGLSNPVAVGTDWSTAITNGTLTAIYIGTFPVATGASLPSIVIFGQVAGSASPTLSNIATVSTPGDSNPVNDSSSDTVPIVAHADMVPGPSHGGTEYNSSYVVGTSTNSGSSTACNRLFASAGISITGISNSSGSFKQNL